MNEKREKLSEIELEERLRSLPEWSVSEGKLHRDYSFRDFIEAFSFMTGAALVIQSMDHHPEWRNVYHKVSIDLVTHDEGGITGVDIELAGRLEELAARIAPK